MTTKPEVSLQPTDQTALMQLVSDPEGAAMKLIPVETVERLFALHLKVKEREAK